MKLVIDASVAAKWFFKEPGTDDALALLDACDRGVVEFWAPEIITAEMANLIWKKVLRAAVDPHHGYSFFDDFRRIPVRFTPAFELAGVSLRLAVSFRHSAYDCLYVALAAREGCEMVTADAKLFGAFRAAFPQVRMLMSHRPIP
jgi:predicted nucleic acid-binding protein